MSFEVNLNMEIGKLEPSELYILGTILNSSDGWKKLMAIVPKAENVPKFTTEHISMIEQAARNGFQGKRNAAEIFLDEWSTMGKKRPTLGILLELLIKAGLFRAADYIACDILKQEAPERPGYGPAACIDISDTTINKLLEKQLKMNEMNGNNLFDESIISGVILETKFISVAHPCDDRVNNHNENSSSIINESSIDKEVTNVTSPEIMSDLMKFSVAETCRVVTNPILETASSSIPKHLLPSFIEEGSRNDSEQAEILRQYYKDEELSSQELPIFLNNSKKTIPISIEELCSSDVPLCLK